MTASPDTRRCTYVRRARAFRRWGGEFRYSQPATEDAFLGTVDRLAREPGGCSNWLEACSVCQRLAQTAAHDGWLEADARIRSTT